MYVLVGLLCRAHDLPHSLEIFTSAVMSGRTHKGCLLILIGASPTLVMSAVHFSECIKYCTYVVPYIRCSENLTLCNLILQFQFLALSLSSRISRVSTTHAKHVAKPLNCRRPACWYISRLWMLQKRRLRDRARRAVQTAERREADLQQRRHRLAVETGR